MIQIIYCPEEYERIVVRFKCRGCGCIWDADQADYERRETIAMGATSHKQPKVIEDNVYFKATCPICGFPGTFNADEVKYFRETDYNDGTASTIEINKEDINYEKF